MFQMSSVKRVTQRLESMLFRLRFPEMVDDIKPVSHSLICMFVYFFFLILNCLSHSLSHILEKKMYC